MCTRQWALYISGVRFSGHRVKPNMAANGALTYVVSVHWTIYIPGRPTAVKKWSQKWHTWGLFGRQFQVLRGHPGCQSRTVSSIYIYIYMEWDLPVTDRTKSEAKYDGHGGSKLRRFQSPCAIFTIHVNMKDRVERRRKLGPPLTAIFGFTRWPEDLTPDQWTL